MKTILAHSDRNLSGKIESSVGKPMHGAICLIVNRFFQEMESARGRQALRALNLRLLEDIGLTPLDHDRLLG
jgi:uncharacterized protein YjiS (DUF1127 family)